MAQYLRLYSCLFQTTVQRLFFANNFFHRGSLLHGKLEHFMIVIWEVSRRVDEAFEAWCSRTGAGGEVVTGEDEGLFGADGLLGGCERLLEGGIFFNVVF